MGDVSQIPADIVALRKAFSQGTTRPLSWRRKQLSAIVKLIDEREAELCEALHADMGRTAVEAWGGDLALTRSEAEYALDHLDAWCNSKSSRLLPLVQQPGKIETRQEPLGVVLIIGPWNYPLQLVLTPLVGALAAGNCVAIKPSEVSEKSSALLASLLPQYLDPECIKVFEGGVAETTKLLEQRFDHIFYTGNSNVGRIVMTAAAKHLTPVTLELGGKSPCIFDDSACRGTSDFEVAVRRTMWAKLYNAGQTCIAPDYVLVPRDRKAAFVEQARVTVEQMYGKDPQKSPDLARVINGRHIKRLQGLLDKTNILYGGTVDESDNYFGPTIVEAASDDASILGEEIFGPILLVVPYDTLEAALDFVLAREKPLVLYLFTRSSRVRETVLERTSSGGVCVNDLLAQMAVHEFSFGGVGESGFGRYHGDDTFRTFSHSKSILHKSLRVDPSIRYPPYTDSKKRWLKRLI